MKAIERQAGCLCWRSNRYRSIRRFETGDRSYWNLRFSPPRGFAVNRDSSFDFHHHTLRGWRT
jgi:hypothetical protein